MCVCASDDEATLQERLKALRAELDGDDGDDDDDSDASGVGGYNQLCALTIIKALTLLVFGCCGNSARENDWRCRKRGTQAT